MCDENLRNLGFEYWPENGHRCTHDRKINFEARKNDGNGWPPGEVDVRMSSSAILDYGVQTPYRGEYDASMR